MSLLPKAVGRKENRWQITAKDLKDVLYSYGSNMVCQQMRSAEHQVSITKR